MNFTADISVLLVEDDENLGFVTQEGLEDKGYHVVWAKDGVEGYEVFQSSKFSICLMCGSVLCDEVGGVSSRMGSFRNDNALVGVSIWFVPGNSASAGRIVSVGSCQTTFDWG